MPPATDRELARLDVLKREIVILSSRLSKVISDTVHLQRALRDVMVSGIPTGTEEDLQSEASRQPSLGFGSGSVEDYD